MLREIIDRWAVKCPDRIAHQYREQALSYLELKLFSDALAVWIRESIGEEQGVHSPIVVYGHKESEMLISFLACIKAGHPYVPVDTSVPLERARQIIESSGAKLLLSPQELPHGLERQGLLILDKLAMRELKTLRDYLGQVPPLDWQVGTEEVYYIIFTSGSTGTPKGVQITLGALESYLNWVNTTHTPVPRQEIFLNQAPFSFDLSVMDLYMSLSTGGTLWSIDKAEIANPRELFQSFSRSGMSIWVSTPSFAEVCLMDKSFDAALMPKLKHLLFCGEVLPSETVVKLHERFPRAKVENLYGPTEATVAVTTMTITPEILAEFNPLPVGKVKPDAQVLICAKEDLDQVLRETDRQGPPPSLPTGERGEIVIAGPNVSIGYLHNPEQTERAFFSWRDENGKQWRAYRTGDAGAFKGDYLFFYGRLDFQVKLHGYRIELGDIEENLRKIPGLDNAVVLPIEKRGRVEYLHAFVTTTQAVEEEFSTSQALKKALRQNLPEYMIPRRFSFVKVLPMTPNGKVNRQALLGGSQ